MLLREWFPEPDSVDEMNFVLFSTSGVHGGYTTIEEIEQGLAKYGKSPSFMDDDWPDDYNGNSLTFLVVQPRIVGMTFGNMIVTLEDIPYLKAIRQASWNAVCGIGRERVA